MKNNNHITSFVKLLYLILTRKILYISKRIHWSHRWYRNKYGVFFVNDESLTKNSNVYSFGIGEDISFDNAIINKHSCRVYGFDPAPKSITWIKNQQISSNFVFFEFGIGSKNEFVEFYLPKNPNHVSGSIVTQNNVNKTTKISVELKNLETIMEELGHQCIDVLKMDIEGAEYEVIDNVLKSNCKIKQVLIEFHHRFIDNGAIKTRGAIKKMSDHGYKVFAVSDSFEEISFLNMAYYQE